VVYSVVFKSIKVQ